MPSQFENTGPVGRGHPVVLSTAMADTIVHMARDLSALHRMPGDCWTTLQGLTDCDGSGTPRWYVDWHIVQQLERRGLVERIGLADELRAPRRLTAAGLDAVLTIIRADRAADAGGDRAQVV